MFSNCPTCGALLSTKLVERIADPQAEESCPRFAEVRPVDQFIAGLPAYLEKITSVTFEPVPA